MDRLPSSLSSLSSLRFGVVDVETSGLDVARHHVLQVGLVVVDGEGTVFDRWSSLVAPRRRWFFRVGPTWLHGIHRRQVRAAPPAVEVLGELARRLEGARLVAHNARFDVAFLRKAAAAAGLSLPISGTVCTLELSRRLDPERRLSHRLGDVCARFGVALDAPHDALADATATAAVLPLLLRAHGITDGAQLPVPS